MTPVEIIRRYNDTFRRSFIGGRVVFTDGVAFSEKREEIISAVREFEAFSEDNDPRGEHDFGNFEIGGEKFYWKIDYYDRNFEYGEDPYANHEAVRRVLTVMRADEY